MAVGRHLARLGVLGRFAVDFVVVRDATGTWTPYAIELNLRKGGTTHPFLTLQFLTDGAYDGDRGLFLTPTGTPKHLVATDHLEHPALRALTADDLFEIVATHGLHFDHARQTGVVFHMISALTEAGRLGLTAVADSRARRARLYDRVAAVVVGEAGTRSPRPPWSVSRRDDEGRSPGGTGLVSSFSVELRGLEPLTPSMPWRCATSCATAPPPRDCQGNSGILANGVADAKSGRPARRVRPGEAVAGGPACSL